MRNFNGDTLMGVNIQVGYEKLAILDQYLAIFQRRYDIRVVTVE